MIIVVASQHYCFMYAVCIYCHFKVAGLFVLCVF